MINRKLREHGFSIVMSDSHTYEFMTDDNDQNKGFFRPLILTISPAVKGIHQSVCTEYAWGSTEDLISKMGYDTKNGIQPTDEGAFWYVHYKYIRRDSNGQVAGAPDYMLIKWFPKGVIPEAPGHLCDESLLIGKKVDPEWNVLFETPTPSKHEELIIKEQAKAEAQFKVEMINKFQNAGGSANQVMDPASLKILEAASKILEKLSDNDEPKSTKKTSKSKNKKVEEAN